MVKGLNLDGHVADFIFAKNQSTNSESVRRELSAIWRRLERKN